MNELDKAKAQADAKMAIIGVIDSKTADMSIRAVAMVKAKYDAYLKVGANFERFIVMQSQELSNYSGDPRTMLSLAKLIFDWLLRMEDFIAGSEDVLKELGMRVRKQFTEGLFSDFPADVRKKLLVELKERQRGVVVWLGKRIQEEKECLKRV